MQRKVTKPRQGASPRALDRWQVEVLWMLKCTNSLETTATTKVDHLRAGLGRLLRSLRKAERR